jgi:uncharacterized glyoxalase superfamily protein PhnB
MTMRFMIMVKADKSTEAGVMPSERLLTEMGQFNEELVKAGVLLAAEGLQPSSKGARVKFAGSKRSVIDGPFAESKELIAGFWLWQVKSKEEAIEWVKRCPKPLEGDAEIEIRQVFEASDFGKQAAPRVTPVPESRGATPYLIVKGAADAIGFYQRVFGAELLMRLNAPDGSVMHAELKVGPAHFMLTEERPEYRALSPQAIGGSASSAIVYVEDADAAVQRALDAGSQIIMPLADQFWGDRSAGIVDPFGHHWMVATHIEDPSPEEIQRRAQAMFAKG